VAVPMQSLAQISPVVNIPAIISPDTFRNAEAVAQLPAPALFEGSFIETDLPIIVAPSTFQGAGVAAQLPKSAIFEDIKAAQSTNNILGPDSFDGVSVEFVQR